MAGLPINFLSGLVGRQPSNNSIGSVSNQTGFPVDANTKALMSLLDSLSNGETIVGKVLSQKDGLLQILTGDNITINAAVADNVSLTEGATALFEVNKSSDNKVSLRPLYHNMASEATASAAIKQAGLPLNDRTLEMVARNMEYGNPIDRNSLIKAFRDVALFPDVPVKYITDLQKMGIPASQANFEQYEAYLNMENSVSEAFSTIGDSIINELENSLSMLQNSEAESIPVAEQTIDPAALTGEETVLVSEETVFEQVSSDTAKTIVSSNPMVDSLLDFAETLKDVKASDLSFSKAEVVNIAAEFEGFDQAGSLKELISTETEEFSPTDVFKAVLKDISSSVKNGTVKLPTELADAETVGAKIENINRLPASFKEILSRALSSQWALDREKISDKGQVRELYDRLFEQSTKLLGTLTEHVGKESPVTQTVRNLSDNLQFMNSLNNYVPYVQIPFRGQSGNTGSELYVYKNKRSLAEGDSEVSAFIHLDMESLGPTDVFVKLKDSNVTTKFTLADDAALDLISENIDFLNKRLNDKGYTFNAEMIKQDERKAPVAEMLLNTTDRLMVSRTSFDARI